MPTVAMTVRIVIEHDDEGDHAAQQRAHGQGALAVPLVGQPRSAWASTPGRRGRARAARRASDFARVPRTTRPMDRSSSQRRTTAATRVMTIVQRACR